MSGALDRVRVVEMAGIGPSPFTCMMLADHGADVLRVTRPGQTNPLPVEPRFDLCNRGRPEVMIDLGTQAGRDALWRLIGGADALVEGFRPGVMERLGFGPDEALARHPRLVYGRMTGWGREGPLATAAGHDLNFAGLTGAVAALGDPGRPPPPPLNMVADFGGGGMLLAFGVVAALLEARHSGRGQVVDAAMLDGVGLLMAMPFGMREGGVWGDARGANLLDGGTPFYACYETADGRHVSVCPLEPRFFAAFLERLDLHQDPDFAHQYDRATWPRMAERLTALFRTRSRDDWAALFEGTDACVFPVLTMGEAPEHPHARARGGFVAVDGVRHPVPAPRLSRTPAGPPGPSGTTLALEDALARWGV